MPAHQNWLVLVEFCSIDPAVARVIVVDNIGVLDLRGACFHPKGDGEGLQIHPTAPIDICATPVKTQAPSIGEDSVWNIRARSIDSRKIGSCSIMTISAYIRRRGILRGFIKRPISGQTRP